MSYGLASSCHMKNMQSMFCTRFLYKSVFRYLDLHLVSIVSWSVTAMCWIVAVANKW